MNNNQATLEKLQQMRLYGMVRAFRATMDTAVKHSYSADELVSHLVDTEWDDRHNRKVQRLIKAAKFRYAASFEQIDFNLPRNLDRNQILRLSDSSWVERHQNVLLTGPTGVGKSFIAQALGHQACLYGFRTRYYPCSKLFETLKVARAEGSYLAEMERISRQEVFVLDDIGLHPFDTSSRLSLLEILEDRLGRKSTIVVSQIPISSWHAIIGDQTVADAICDRIVHSSQRIELKGESVRKTYCEGERQEESA